MIIIIIIINYHNDIKFNIIKYVILYISNIDMSNNRKSEMNKCIDHNIFILL